jgi:hypothetical protein
VKATEQRKRHAARGEIDKAEYEEKRQIVSGRSGPLHTTSTTPDEPPASTTARRRSGERKAQ